MTLANMIYKMVRTGGSYKPHQHGRHKVNATGVPFSDLKFGQMVKWSYKNLPELHPLFNMLAAGSVFSVIFMAYKLFKWDIVLNKGHTILPQEYIKDRSYDFIDPRPNTDDLITQMTKEKEETWGLKERSEHQRQLKAAKYHQQRQSHNTI